MAIVEVSIIPLGTGRPSLSDYVAKAVEVLHGSGLSYEITPMGTIINGDLGEIFRVIKEMHESCFDSEVKRVLTLIKIDDRRDKEVKPGNKVTSVKEKLIQKGVLR